MNPSGLVLRPATAADIPCLRDLASRIWHACYPGIIGEDQIEYMLGWMYSAERLAADLARGVRFAIAEVDGVPSGYLATEADPGSGTLHLHKLYLLPESQGRGLGQAMLEEVGRIAAAAGLAQVELRVNKSNHRALRAYRRAGFEVREAVVADIGGGFVMDDFILVRR